jgi:hypothetical protein
MPIGHERHRFGPCERRSLALAVVRALAPCVERIQPLLVLTRGTQIPPVHVQTMEEPGYPYARLLFRSLGAHLVGVPVDEEGLDVDAIPGNARLVYVTDRSQPRSNIVSAAGCD